MWMGFHEVYDLVRSSWFGCGFCILYFTILSLSPLSLSLSS